MPVAITPVDRQVWTALGKFPFDRRNQGPVLSVDRSLAAEMIIVLGDLEHAFPGSIPAPQDVFEEWNDIFPALRSTEGHKQQSIVFGMINHFFSQFGTA